MRSAHMKRHLMRTALKQKMVGYRDYQNAKITMVMTVPPKRFRRCWIRAVVLFVHPFIRALLVLRLESHVNKDGAKPS